MAFPGHKPLTTQEVVECDICLEVPLEPRILHCTHVFCLDCLQSRQPTTDNDSSGESDTIACPECQQKTELPTGGISKLPTDLRGMEFDKLVRKQKAEKKQAIHITPYTPEKKKTTSAGSESIHFHDLIKNNPKEAKSFLCRMEETKRSKLVAELVDGHNTLTATIKEGALDLMSYVIKECNADVTHASEVTLTLSQQTETTTFPPLVYAAYFGNVAAAKVLIAHGAEVNAANKEGISPLYIASEQNAADMVHYLVESGANVDQKDDLQVTSLMIARKNPEVRSFLLAKGADVNGTNMDSFTAMHYAAAEGCVESLRELLKYGAKVSAKNKHGNSPLHDAVYKSHMDAVKILLMNGADPSAQNKYGNTPLHFAVHTDAKAIAQLLVNQGTDPYIRNNNNEDCFLKAVLEKKKSILDLLTNKHIDVYYKEKN